FVYQVTNVATGDLARIAGDGYTLKKTDVVGSGSGAVPSSATRSTLPADGGDTVSFNFSPAFTSGGSELLIIRTDATGFEKGDITVFNSGTGSASLSGFSPTPEPATFALFGLQGAGLGAFFLYRRRMRLQKPALV